MVVSQAVDCCQLHVAKGIVSYLFSPLILDSLQSEDSADPLHFDTQFCAHGANTLLLLVGPPIYFVSKLFTQNGLASELPVQGKRHEIIGHLFRYWLRSGYILFQVIPAQSCIGAIRTVFVSCGPRILFAWASNCGTSSSSANEATLRVICVQIVGTSRQWVSKSCARAVEPSVH